MNDFNRTTLKYKGKIVAIFPCDYKALCDACGEFRKWIHEVRDHRFEDGITNQLPSRFIPQIIGKLDIHHLNTVYFDEIVIENFSYDSEEE